MSWKQYAVGCTLGVQIDCNEYYSKMQNWGQKGHGLGHVTDY